MSEKMKYEVDFLFAGIHQSFLQISAYCLWWAWPGVPKVPKLASNIQNNKLYLCNISRKK